MGITAGEGMPHAMDAKVKESWLWDTYGEGVRDALKTEPQRTFHLIHRFHWTAQGDILDAFKDYPGPFDFSFKYSVAHMYSIPNPPFIQPLLQHLAPGRKTWLTVRNDDIYTFRFGDPAYARDYILNIPSRDKIAGFYMGPEGYVWGRDFLERHPDSGKRPLVMDKQWYSFMIDQTIFADIAAARRPAKFIYRAPLSANTGSGGTTSEENDRRSRAQIESLTNNITGPIYVEFKHNWSHAHSSPDLFIVHGGKLSDAYWNPPPTRHKVVWTMRNEDLFVLRWGEPDFVRQFVAKQGDRDHVAGGIIGSECYIPALDYISKEGPKLRAGVALATARATGNLAQQGVAIAELEAALIHWKSLAKLGATFNQLPVPSNSREPFSWSALTPAVVKDIESARAPLSAANPTR